MGASCGAFTWLGSQVLPQPLSHSPFSKGEKIQPFQTTKSFYNSVTLSIISERSWWPGEAPKEWKTENVSSIFKQGKEENPGKYRLVSLGRRWSKYSQISKCMKDKVTGCSQHGFCNHEPCNTAEFVIEIAQKLCTESARPQAEACSP